MLVFAAKNAEIPENFHKNSWIWENFLETSVKFWNFLIKSENAKKFSEIWLKFWMPSGAKSVSIFEELSNEYLLAEIGFDPAENEPLKVWQQLTKR